MNGPLRPWMRPASLPDSAPGTENIGRLFGPIMVIWFVSIALFGLIQILPKPRVLRALNPAHAVDFFMRNGTHGMVVLGSVVLCITGCEDLHADLGHFGRNAIRLSCLGFACPSPAGTAPSQITG